MSYVIEIRESLHDGDDYSESNYEFDTPDEVQHFINNDLSEDERIHSILYYPEGQDYNPKDVTHKFKKNKFGKYQK